MNLFALFRDVNSKEQVVEYLQDKNLLHQRRVCRKGHAMKQKLAEKNDRWTCRKGGCHSEVSLRVGTWLEHTNLSLEIIAWFIYCWCQQYTNYKFCDNELLMSGHSCVEWKNKLRAVCARSLLQNPTLIGGEGLTVEIHESCFSPKVSRGKQPQLQQWVFGGVCRETSECFLWAVAEPSAETLLEAVSGGVRPGSTIVSDLFDSYGGSHLLPADQYTLLLSLNKSQSIFVNKDAGNEQPLWSVNKKRKRDESIPRREQDSRLCEFLWRKRHENADLVDQIYKDISSVYPLKDVVE